MNASPVRRYRKPRYPTRLQVLADPALLEKHVPPAWKSRAEMAGMVTFLLATNSCTTLAQKLDRSNDSKPAVVAPIFKHGEGRGATGCVVVNPPVFLSEQDAMQVIKEELRKAGVALSETNVTLKDVLIPQLREYWSFNGGEPKQSVVPSGNPKVLVLDAFDPQKKVGVEYVDAEEYFDLGGEQSGSTVQGYDFKAIAGSVSQQVKSKAHGLYFEAFYDPVAHPPNGAYDDPQFRRRVDALYREREKATDPKVQAEKDKEISALYDELLAPERESSKRLLRQQVKDFVDWLKGQGVI